LGLVLGDEFVGFIRRTVIPTSSTCRFRFGIWAHRRIWEIEGLGGDQIDSPALSRDPWRRSAGFRFVFIAMCVVRLRIAIILAVF
jgi:hypothetical protein